MRSPLIMVLALFSLITFLSGLLLCKSWIDYAHWAFPELIKLSIVRTLQWASLYIDLKVEFMLAIDSMACKNCRLIKKMIAAKFLRLEMCLKEH